jgi:hypothetical protein
MINPPTSPIQEGSKHPQSARTLSTRNAVHQI